MHVITNSTPDFCFRSSDVPNSFSSQLLFCFYSRQSDHTRVWDAGDLRRSQHLPDCPERDAQLPGQELERESGRPHRAADQQQLREDAAPENIRVPEQRRENRKD